MNDTELTMFERLQQLPLLQGMSIKELEDLVFSVQLDFKKHLAGDQVVEQDEACRKLIFVLSGTMSIQYRNEADTIVVTEETKAPLAIEPYSMYGMKQRYTRDYTFETDGSTLTIPKAVFMSELMNFPIIRTNMLNLACNLMQRQTSRLMQGEKQTVTDKVIEFLSRYCTIQKGTKHFKIKMDTIAEMICETRLNVSNALKSLAQENLIMQQRNGFKVYDFAKLLRWQQELNKNTF